MKKVMFVFGTRPEVIKLAPLIEIFSKDKKNFDVMVCNTGQHKEMVDDLVELFNIKVDYNFAVMKENQSLAMIISKILLGFDSNIFNKPEYVFVLGDTITAFIASLYAYQNQIHLCHIEAGLRTGNLNSPWPEEGYRRMIGQISNFHFAPTLESKNNLLQENINIEKIYVTGNTVIDVLKKQLNEIDSNEIKKKQVVANIRQSGYQFSNNKIILITSHRRENFGGGIENICIAIKQLALEYPNFDFVFPVHMNPNVQKIVYNILDGIDNVFLIIPLDYENFTYLMRESYLILTDSGGIQEEAPSLGKPVLVMRDTTERIEAVKYGTVKLIGTLSETIHAKTVELIKNKNEYKKMSEAINPYGDGNASKRILEIMINV